MKILVTGGLGQVGSYLGERLSENNEITILDNFSNSLNNIKFPSNIKIIKGDIRNLKIVNELASKVNTIIHTAAQTSVNKSIEDPTYDAENNINGTLNLLEAARKSDVERFIYISSAAIFNTMENKKAVEDVFNIGTGKPTRINELAEIMIKISNKKLEPELAPAQIAIYGQIPCSISGFKRKRGLEK